jgi:hypothetical protein
VLLLLLPPLPPVAAAAAVSCKPSLPSRLQGSENFRLK